MLDAADRIPILRMGRVLLASIQGDLPDTRALRLLDDVSEAVAATSATGVILEISSLGMIDSFVSSLFTRIAMTTRLLGADLVIAGMQPPVAITMIELGLDFSGIDCARNVEQATAMLGNSPSEASVSRVDDDPH